MSDYNIKNYTERDGQVTHIGGKLIIEEGAEIEGLPSGGDEYELPIASDTTLGGVKIGEGLSITEEGVLSADNGEEQELPIATKNSLGVVKVGNGLNVTSAGVLSASSSGQSVYVSAITVTGTSAEGNININFPGGVARNTMFRPLNSPKVSEYYVKYGPSTEYVYCFMAGIGSDKRAYFIGFSSPDGNSLKQYIIGIDMNSEAPSDVVIIRDIYI